MATFDLLECSCPAVERAAAGAVGSLPRFHDKGCDVVVGRLAPMSA
jgi:hypothetical protein